MQDKVTPRCVMIVIEHSALPTWTYDKHLSSVVIFFWQHQQQP